MKLIDGQAYKFDSSFDADASGEGVYCDKTKSIGLVCVEHCINIELVEGK